MPKIPTGEQFRREVPPGGVTPTRYRTPSVDTSGLAIATAQSGEAVRQIGKMLQGIAVQRQKQDDLNFVNDWKLKASNALRDLYLEESKKQGVDAQGARESYLKAAQRKEAEFFKNVPEHLMDELRFNWEKVKSYHETDVIKHENRQRIISIETIRKTKLDEAKSLAISNPAKYLDFIQEYWDYINDHEQVGTYDETTAEALRKAGASDITATALSTLIKTGPVDKVELQLTTGEYNDLLSAKAKDELIKQAKAERKTRARETKILKAQTEKDRHDAALNELNDAVNAYYDDLIKAETVDDIQELLSDIRFDGIFDTREDDPLGTRRKKEQSALISRLEARAKMREMENDPFKVSDPEVLASVIEDINDPVNILKWIDPLGRADYRKINELIGKEENGKPAGLSVRDAGMLKTMLGNNVRYIPTETALAYKEFVQAFRNFTYLAGMDDPEIKEILAINKEDRTEEERNKLRNANIRAHAEALRQFHEALQSNPEQDPIKLKDSILLPLIQGEVKSSLDKFMESLKTSVVGNVLSFATKNILPVAAAVELTRLTKGRKKLDPDDPQDRAIANKILSEASGDVEKARQIAKAKGYEF